MDDEKETIEEEAPIVSVQDMIQSLSKYGIELIQT